MNQLKTQTIKSNIITDKIKTGFLMIDDNFNIIHANQEFAEITGYNASLIVGSQVFAYLQFCNKKELQRILDDVLRNKQCYNFKINNNYCREKNNMETLRIIFEPIEACYGMHISIFLLKEKKSHYQIEDNKSVERNKVLPQKKKCLDYSLYNDGLTNLYNRKYFDNLMKTIDLENVRPLSFIVGDVNSLKLVNDTFGHTTGDRLLQTVSKVLVDSCRESDLIFRWGGDEFLVVLYRTNLDQAKSVYKRIKNNCLKEKINSMPIALSLGYEVMSGTQTIYDAIQNAEEKMYSEKLKESRQVFKKILDALLKELVRKCPTVEEQAWRLQKVALYMGEELSLSDHQLDKLSTLVSLHDIGKIALPARVVNKKAPLTEREKEILKKHPENGYRMLKTTTEFASLAEEILTHHEFWNGTGYPLGLKGEEIPLLARVIAVIDTYDILLHGYYGDYKISRQQVKQELLKRAATQLDPELVKIFVNKVFDKI